MIANVKPQFLIAAPTSGTGKTTVSRLLMWILKRRGLRVQPFKCGPDYIDTKFHEQVCGLPSYNLDSFMATPAHLKSLYARHAQQADACVVEGMMGLFDGYDRSRGSSAEVARLLDLPVVLVVNAKAASYSLAALIKGYRDFDSQLRMAGVIFNHVGGAGHEESLRDLCRELEMPCLGCLRTNTNLQCGSRHLGLDFSNLGAEDAEGLYETACRQLDVDALLELVSVNQPSLPAEPRRAVCREEGGMAQPVIAVARNRESFSFLYAEHLDILQRIGKVVFFDPEENSPIPADTGFLYLPGGYPEHRLPQLSAAVLRRRSIAQYIERGGKTLAECGGMMYLARYILTGSMRRGQPMVGVLPFSVSFKQEHRRLSLGYRQFEYLGKELRGHEFHYSQIMPGTDAGCTSVAQVYNARGKAVASPVYCYKNLLASYVHLYWGDLNPIEDLYNG